MEILKNFGFDPVMLTAQIVNFLIISYLLKRFLYKPVLEMLKNRRNLVLEGLKQAEESKKTLEKTLEQEKIIISKAQNEGKRIIEEAKMQALTLSKEIEEKTKQQTEKMIQEAKMQIEQEAKETEKRLSENISLLAADMLAKSLEGLFSGKEQKQVITRAIKQIKNLN